MFSSHPGADICKFSAEVNGREETATRRDPGAFMMNPDVFMVTYLLVVQTF